MPEYNYLSLACQKLGVDPQSLLKFHEYGESLYVITSEGKKTTFSFTELEDYHRYLLDNMPPVEPPRGGALNHPQSPADPSKLAPIYSDVEQAFTPVKPRRTSKAMKPGRASKPIKSERAFVQRGLQDPTPDNKTSSEDPDRLSGAK